MNLQDILRITPAVLGVLGAILRLLPGATTAARQRAQSHSTISTPLRVNAYAGPLPWGEHLHRRLISSDGKLALRRQTLLVVRIASPLVLLLGIAYTWLAVAEGIPAWALTVALIIAIAVEATLIRIYSRMMRDPRSYTGARPQSGTIEVSGDRRDVVQYSLASLRALGAKLVALEGNQIIAATGLLLFSNAFLGEFITVQIYDSPIGHAVTIESMKLDYATPSRSKKNVVRFMEMWAFFPAVEARAD